MAEQKTNAMRILDREKIPYQIHTYDHQDGVIDGAHVAQKLGQDPARVYKTLVTRSNKNGIFVFVIPVLEELDLKKAARAAGEKSVEMIHVKEINALTGYIRGGCSPVGMKKRYPTFFQQDMEALPQVCVSGGRIGTQMELDPKDLVRVTQGTLADLIRKEEAL